MIGYVDKNNIDKLSAKLSGFFAIKVAEAIKQATDHGAVRIHESSTHFLASNPKRVCAYVANSFTNRGEKFAAVTAICKKFVYRASLSINSVITVWFAPESVIDQIRKDFMLKPKYYLILIYRELYNPALIDVFLENQKLVTGIYKKGLTKISSMKSGGDSSPVTGGDYNEFYKILNTEVFVGKKAFNYYLEEPMEDVPFEIISDNVSKTILKLKKKFPSISVENSSTAILTDFKFARSTVKINKTVIHIYNSAEYELIPFVTADVRIGAIYVVARFILINLFIRRVIEKNKDLLKYFMEIHDRLITKDFSLDYYVPAIENYYGYSQKEKNMFASCGKDFDYKPMIVKKKQHKLLYF